MALWVTYKIFIWQGAHVKHSLTQIIKGINFHQSSFINFSVCNLEWLKDEDEWLSDSHVTLSLLWVSPFGFGVSSI